MILEKTPNLKITRIIKILLKLILEIHFKNKNNKIKIINNSIKKIKN
jgi:hypothetical protein